MRTFLGGSLLLLAGLVGCDADASKTNSRDINKATGTDTSATVDSPEKTRTSPDNTAVNERDSDGNTKTPFDQSETAEDREITAKIRREVVDLPDASINAQNVKIIAAGGKVTLRGPVENQAEREAIESIAKKVAGDTNVDNQLEVAPK
jgi:hyperosmotically inducible periplasmic protein